MGMLIWILYDIIYKISQKSAEGLIWELEVFFLSWDWCIHGYSNRLIINWNPDVQQWLSAWWKYIYIFIYLYIYIFINIQQWLSALIINCVPNRSDDEDPTRDVLSEKKRSLLDAQKRYHPVVKYGNGKSLLDRHLHLNGKIIHK